MKKTFLNKCKKVTSRELFEFNREVHNGNIRQIELLESDKDLFKVNMLSKEYYFNSENTINTDLNQTKIKKYEKNNKQFYLIIENLGAYQCISKNIINYYIKEL